MDVADITTMKAGQVADKVDVAVLKKAQDLAASQASQLIQALPQASANSSGIGGNFDMTA